MPAAPVAAAGDGRAQVLVAVQVHRARLDLRARTCSMRNGSRRSIDARSPSSSKQQPAAIVRDDQLDVHAAREQRRQRARGVDRAACAGDRDRDRA